ncbi:MAG: ATP-binding protein [Candidatus Aenigmarchaeota archaeon]|nr:ATP-binding protein [Candidatus Aenigmarchaeota archaeon]
MDSGVRVYLGKSQERKIFWQPGKEKNPHFLVVGTSGSGKTESLKSIVHELRAQGVPSLIVDFHNEYSDIAEYRINLRELTINPLEVAAGRRPQDVIYEVASIVKKIFGLGDRQESMLRSAIKDCYTDQGIDILKEAEHDLAAPPFMKIREQLEKGETATNRGIREALISRIEPLFEVDIFFKENTAIPFEEIVRKTTTIELKDFPTEDVKAAIAEFFLNKLIYYLYKSGKADRLRVYCVVDEAHRLLYENSPLDRLLREARKYGTGIILSSQRPSDFSETVLANAGGILSLQCNLEKDAKFIGKQLSIEPADILHLTEPGLGFVKLSSGAETSKVKIDPLEGRLTEEERQQMEKAKKKITDLPSPPVPEGADQRRPPEKKRNKLATTVLIKGLFSLAYGLFLAVVVGWLNIGQAAEEPVFLFLAGIGAVFLIFSLAELLAYYRIRKRPTRRTGIRKIAALQVPFLLLLAGLTPLFIVLLVIGLVLTVLVVIFSRTPRDVTKKEKAGR